jgi:hypothetical protein
MEEANSDGNQANAQDVLEFEIQVIATRDTTEEDLDIMTRNLLSELRETDVESVDLVSSEAAPLGSKGDPITIGTLAMTVMPIVLPVVIDMIKAWASRGQGRTVKFKGKGIEFEGSPEELQKLLASLKKQRKKR